MDEARVKEIARLAMALGRMYPDMPFWKGMGTAIYLAQLTDDEEEE